MHTLVLIYETAKTWLVDTSGISKDALHIYVALMVQFAAAQMFRRRLASGWPLLLLLLLEIANEAADYSHYRAWGPDPMAGWAGDTARDLFDTLCLPLIVFAIARLRPGRLVAAADQSPGD